MDPFTHAFTSLALSQTMRSRLPRFGLLMLVVAGIAPDLDAAGFFISPGAFFLLHRTALHSLPGALALTCAIAYAFCRLDKEIPFSHPHKRRPAPLTFRAAVTVCAIGVVGHILFDLVSGVGVQLLWPFHGHWYGTDLVVNLDPWALAILVIGFLLPLLLRMVNEEVGARKKSGIGIAAIVTLVVACGYLGERANLRSQAVTMLMSREYHGREPLSAHAYPTLSTPFLWRGIVTTDNTLEHVDVPVPRSDAFDAERSLTYYKPEDSPQLRAGQATAAAKRFLLYAQDPVATVDDHNSGYRFELRDARFATDDTSPENVVLRVDFDGVLRFLSEGYRYSTVLSP